MITCQLQATSRAPASMDYVFIDDDGRCILSSVDVHIVDQFDFLLRELPIIPYTLSLIDADGNERFSLEKKTLITQSFPAYRLVFPRGAINFIEDKTRFSLPNICFKYGGKKYQLEGLVREREFWIPSESDDHPLATIKGSLVPGGKSYEIHIASDALPLEVYFASALVLDIYYHNY